MLIAGRYIPLAAIALVLAAGGGCGDGGDSSAATPTERPLPTIVYPPTHVPGTCVNLQFTPVPCVTPPWSITTFPTIVLNTQTPTPTRVAQPPQATISCFMVNGTPKGPCPTQTPSPN